MLLGRLPAGKVVPTVATVVRVRTRPAVAEGTELRLQRRTGAGRWTVDATATANAAGRASFAFQPGRGVWRVRAVVLTDPRARSRVGTVRVGWPPSRVLLRAPSRVDPAGEVTLRAVLNRPVQARLALQARPPGSRTWRNVETRTASVVGASKARTVFTTQPSRRGTWTYRVVKKPGAGGARQVSAARQVRIAAPGPPAFTSSVSRVNPSQVRFSHRAGCPVAVSQLRNLRMQYWDYGGKVRSGTVVLRADAVDAVRTVFRRAYEQKFPFKLVKPLEGYYAGGARSPHDSDVAAMNAGNTGAFNCRPVVGNPYRTSQHSYGNAIDYNTIQNPYVTASRVYPQAGRAYLDRSRYRAGMILPGSVVATTMASRGWPWGARWAYPDYQHFSSNGG